MHAELRAADFRAVYHLLGECQELWLDPAAWQDHLLAGISRLIHLPIGLRTAIDGFASRRPARLIEAREHGWEDAAAQTYFARMMQQNGLFASAPLDCRFRQLVSQHGDLTLRRADVIADRAWPWQRDVQDRAPSSGVG